MLLKIYFCLVIYFSMGPWHDKFFKMYISLDILGGGESFYVQIIFSKYFHLSSTNFG